jgi:biopolymer transport protein ExbD
MASWERWVFYALALMLAHVVVVAARVSYCYLAARRAEPADHASEEFQRARKKLIADLSFRVHGLKSVAVTAPHLGLLGACFGILGGFTGYSGTKHGFVVLIATAGMMALLATAAGILVAVPATLSYNLLRTRIEFLQAEVDSKWRTRDSRGSRVAQSLPLAPRFSRLPVALIVAAVLALYIMAFLTFASFDTATGLWVGLAPDRCQSPAYERVIVLHVTKDKVLINTEEEDWTRLAVRLSDIYSLRADRTLHLLADDDASFQTVADAIDLASSVSFAGTSDRLGIRVELITPAATSANCPEVWRVLPVYPRQSGK